MLSILRKLLMNKESLEINKNNHILFIYSEVGLGKETLLKIY